MLGSTGQKPAWIQLDLVCFLSQMKLCSITQLQVLAVFCIGMKKIPGNPSKDGFYIMLMAHNEFLSCLLCLAEALQRCIASPSWSIRRLVLGPVGIGWLTFPRHCRFLVFLPLRVQIDLPRANRCSSMPRLPSHAAPRSIRSTRMAPGKRLISVLLKRPAYLPTLIRSLRRLTWIYLILLLSMKERWVERHVRRV